EQREDSPAFHPGLPPPPRPEEVAMDQPQPHAMNRQIIRFGNDLRPKFARVEWAEPRIMVARHDGERAPVAAKLGQGAEALATRPRILDRPRPHPEVTQVADDDQGVIAAQPAHPVPETAVAL